MELVAIVNCPDESESEFGLKCNFRLRVLPTPIVTGRFPCPSTEKELSDRVN